MRPSWRVVDPAPPPEHRDAGADLEARTRSKLFFDYDWYTPRASDEDYVFSSPPDAPRS